VNKDAARSIGQLTRLAAATLGVGLAALFLLLYGDTSRRVPDALPDASVAPAKTAAELLAREFPNPGTRRPTGDPSDELSEQAAEKREFLASDEALVRVAVVSAEQGEPLVGAQPQLIPESVRDGWAALRVFGSRARLGEIPTTDDSGRAEFIISVNERCVLSLFINQVKRSEEIQVPALAPGEIRDILVQVPINADILFFGRIVDEDLQPATSASLTLVSLDHPEGEPLSSSIHQGNGEFRVSAASWTAPFLVVDATGFSRTIVGIVRGHSEPARALGIQLLRSASLVIAITDMAGSRAPDVCVRISVESIKLLHEAQDSAHYWSSGLGYDQFWEQTTGKHGRCRFNDLPTWPFAGFVQPA